MARSRPRPGRDALLRRSGVAVVLSLAANLMIAWVVTTTAAVSPFQPLAYPRVAGLTVVGAVGASLVYAILVRRTDRPIRTFGVVVAAVLLVSFVPDLTLAAGFEGATPAGIAVLMAMHVTVAAICFAVLTRGVTWTG